MTIAIFGAYGFLGKHLVTKILEETDWEIIAVSRKRRDDFWNPKYDARVKPVVGDVRDFKFVKLVLQKVDVAYYLVHFMGHKDIDMYEHEKLAAQTFAKAARGAKLKRLIYMGGLGEHSEDNSPHLQSRYQTGVELRKAAPLVIELQASMIIGRGSVAFDIIDNITKKLPLIVLPKSTATKTQPIARNDVVEYLLQAATIKINQHSIVQVGGKSILTYDNLYRSYLKYSGRHQKVIISPLVSPNIEAKFLNVLIPKVHARIGKEIMESLTTEMIVKNDSAKKLFPKIKPVNLETAFKQAN